MLFRSDATLWRDLAESAKDLKKGDPVLITGRLTNESWTDKDGNKRSSTKIEATRVEALTRGAAPGTATTPAAPRQATASAARPQTQRAAATAAQGSRSAGLDIDSGLQDFPPEEDLPF